MQHFIVFTASNDIYTLKTFKFKVHKWANCIRLLNYFKKEGNTINTAFEIIHLEDGKIMYSQFNIPHFNLTGNLIPFINKIALIKVTKP